MDDVVRETWDRYFYIRDTGHSLTVEKMYLCDQYFLGDQWPAADIDRLNAQKRPALTINKTLSRLAAVFGEQIRTRADIGFQLSSKGEKTSGEIVSRVWRSISSRNKLKWLRSDVFADGAIMSRGWYDVRLDFDTNVYGDIGIEKGDAKSVMVDPDATTYDPDHWMDVLVTRWMSETELEAIYGPGTAKDLKNRSYVDFPNESDVIVRFRDRFRDKSMILVPWGYGGSDDDVNCDIRIVERQKKEVAEMEYFADPMTGDLRVVPYSWDRNRIADYVQKRRVSVIRKKGLRIKWIQVVGGEVVENEWSPYRHFTTVPYFPFFRNGKTTGLVEHLMGPQELLNKSLSQELHIINTSANSGWKIRQNSLKNMEPAELENRGAETGLLLVLDEVVNAEKIQPNNIPQGMDRMAMRAESFFGGVSGVPDAMIGQAANAVPAKAQRQQMQSGSMNLTAPLDNLARTDFYLARAVLDIVQEFYVEERVFRVIVDPFTGETEEIRVNYQDDTDDVLNDLTEGTYDITVTSQPDQETFEETQFDQAMEMREKGVKIPDEVIIANSKLADKHALLESMKKAQPPPEQQAELEKVQAEIKKIYAEIDRINADALRKRTSAIEGVVKAKNDAEAGGREQENQEAAVEAEQPQPPQPDYKASAKRILKERGVKNAA